MTILICTILVCLCAYYFSDFIKKYSSELYVFFTGIVVLSAIHSIFLLNNYSVTYISGIRGIMHAIDSGILSTAIFILVMYMGVFENKLTVSKKMRRNRAELSIIASILIMPHMIHYFFNFIFNRSNLANMQGVALWATLMTFVTGVFAIIIMWPLFITSFVTFKRKLGGKKWKSLQQYAYFFYALIFIHVIVVYMIRPQGFTRDINLAYYTTVFTVYTVLKIRLIMSKKMVKQKLAK